jgi:hypothetical protein
VKSALFFARLRRLSLKGIAGFTRLQDGADWNIVQVIFLSNGGVQRKKIPLAREGLTKITRTSGISPDP